MYLEIDTTSIYWVVHSLALRISNRRASRFCARFLHMHPSICWVLA